MNNEEDDSESINTILRWTENPLRRHEPDRPDDTKGDENFERNTTMELEDPGVTKNFDMSEFAYLRYFQSQTTKDAEFTAGLYELRNRIIVAGQTYFSYIRNLTMNIVTVRAYFNYSQYLKMKDPELIARYQWLRNTKGT